MVFVFFFKQKTAYEVRISDWSSDVCSSDLANRRCNGKLGSGRGRGGDRAGEAGVDEGIVGAEQPAGPLARRVDRVRYRAITLLENAVRRSEDGPRFGCRDERLAVEAERGRSAGPFLFQRRTILDAELGIARPFRDLAQALRRLDAEMRRALKNFRAPLAELRKNSVREPRDLDGSMLSLHVEALSEVLHIAAQMRVVDPANHGVAVPQRSGEKRV